MKIKITIIEIDTNEDDEYGNDPYTDSLMEVLTEKQKGVADFIRAVSE